MNIGIFFRTIIFLKRTQIYHQIRNRLYKPKYKVIQAPVKPYGKLRVLPIPKYRCVEGNHFSFLNLEKDFSGWNYVENGMLWAYNQNYFDWINQGGFSEEEGCKWIDMFIEELPNNKIGLEPYPIALRSINWVKFFCQYPEAATKARLDSLFSQIGLLEKKLEFHLLGNHLLEDAYALYIGAAYFGDKHLLKKAKRLLLEQLNEQVLPDGAHYEQSPMYHSILLDRLLDCINIYTLPELEQYASKMLGHLESIVWEDGSIPMLNDSACEIAPTAEMLFGYAYRMGLAWRPIPMKECGYRKFKGERLEAIVDVGEIKASYQPGHSHADTFSFEIRIDGNPILVDTGITTYNKNNRRQYERSIAAHNTVSVEGKDSSEVWGGFRVGRRAKVRIVQDLPNLVQAVHDGFRDCSHTRTFQMLDDQFVITDEVEDEAISYLHFAPGVVIKEWNKDILVTNYTTIILNNVCRIDIKQDNVSKGYNKLEESLVANLYFNRQMSFMIKTL